jgi:hypothetical protein
MGYNARNDEIHENLERMRRKREAYEDSLAIIGQFNARLSPKKTAWFWPTVAAVLACITGSSSRATLATPSLISI